MKKLNVLLLGIYTFTSLKSGYIFADLITVFRDNGHNVYVVSAREDSEKNEQINNEGIRHLRIGCGPIQKTSAVKKVLNLRKLDIKSKKALKRLGDKTKFDLIVTMVSHCAFYRTAKYIRKRDGAFLYNMVKDIFPRNAADIGLLKKEGILYRWFERKEQRYYEISDCLGVISPASIKILADAYPQLKDRIEVNPNTVLPRGDGTSGYSKEQIRLRYDLPADKPVFIYGGNLGKPQGLDFLLDLILENEREGKIFYLIIGNGTEYGKMADFFIKEKISNSKLLSKISAEEFFILCKSSDAGLVFLNRNFTVPNYPSRILSYMEAALPVLFAVDAVCDAGIIAEINGYGYNCLNGEKEKFLQLAHILADDNERREGMGLKARQFLLDHYTADKSYDIIMGHFKE